MIILESILDDETLVQRNTDAAQELSGSTSTSPLDELPFRIYTKVGFSNSQIINGELQAVNIRLFLDELNEIFDHCCFMKEHTTYGTIKVIEGANIVREELEFPVDDDSVTTLYDSVDIKTLKKKYPTVALEFYFTTAFSVPNKVPKY